MYAYTEALLFAAARHQHLIEKILPNIHKGNIVLCDRYIDSSIVYQGMVRGGSVPRILQFNSIASSDENMPDMTFFFDVKPEIALQRISKDKDREINRLDRETLNFHENVYEGFKELSKIYPNRIITIDASKSLLDVVDQCLYYIEQKLKEKE